MCLYRHDRLWEKMTASLCGFSALGAYTTSLIKQEKRLMKTKTAISVAVMRSFRWRVEFIPSSDTAVYRPVYMHRYEMAWLGGVQGSADSLTGDSWKLMLTSGSMGTALSLAGGLKKST